MTSRSLTVEAPARGSRGHATQTLRAMSRRSPPGFPLTWIPVGSYNSLSSMSEFTHFNESGRARMVDVSEKAATHRTATAQARILMQPETLEKIRRGKIAKGDVLAVAQTAGILGAKRTPDLIPMCHPLLITSVDIDFKEDPQPDRSGYCSITATATVKTTGQTGVEMAALTIYDMCKAVDRGMVFTDIGLLEKAGGKSGTYTRKT